jgi:transposase
MNQYQLIPYKRTAEYFADQMGLPLSVGSIFNFNKDAYKRLENIESVIKKQLIESNLIHADETSINVGSKRIWLHSASNDKWAHCFPHNKRGTDAMNEVGVLSEFKGILCHDHWKSYYKYQQCLHALCNAHHLRELEAIINDDERTWPKAMQDLLKEMNHQTKLSGGILEKDRSDMYKTLYRELLQKADKEDPPPIRKDGQKGRLKKTTARNLLERLRDFEYDTLKFMDICYVPFTNNMGENDLRMNKVKEKISGCFRSIDGALMFCRIRSYLLTCQKHNMHPTQALKILFDGDIPEFLK